jgi:hypothetical protein
VTPWELFDYDLTEYPFPELVRLSLGVTSLYGLEADLPKRTWQTDQQSPWHPLFYGDFHTWQRVYDAFVREVVAERVEEPFYYQRVPTFRVQLPGNTAVGELHTDAQYHHPLDEVTMWLPLTAAHGSASLWVQDDDGELQCVNAWPGQIAEFSAAKRLHGNKLNDTGRTRVSFDFRVLPVRLLPTVEGPPTKHTRLRFVPGEYYAEEPCG